MDVTYMQLKGNSGAYIFEMKGWRWEYVMDRIPKIDPLKSFPGASSVNETLAIDFGSHTRHYALMGRVYNQRQFNRLKDYVKNAWFQDQPNTMTIGTGGTKITGSGIVSHMHAHWTEEHRYITILIDFLDVDAVFKW